MNPGLNYILNKQEIITTVSCNDLITRPDEIENIYQQHARTHISLGATSELDRKFLTRVHEAKTPIGAVVAPYGYGKTSTMGFLWNRAEQNEYVATPPFEMKALRDILIASYGWVKYRVAQRSNDLAAHLDQIYKTHTEQTLNEYAGQYARKHGMTQVAAFNMLVDLEKKGELTRDVTPDRLLQFLTEITDVVLQANFNGFVILPDELQQYISRSKTHRSIVEELRQLVWGLFSRKSQFGVLFSMPDYAESAIREAGDDILQRLRKDNFYYNLLGIYGREFPANLWERYGKDLDLGEVGKRIFGAGTLDAIGQIASRPDLGNGPRTVVNLFRLAIENYRDQEKAFTPEVLIDSYLHGDVKFEGQTSKIRAAVNEALAAPIVNSDARRSAIKYLAAFPNTGCPDDIQQKYGIQEATAEISKAGGHGTVIVYQMVGYTLRELQRSGGETDIFGQVARDFWRIYDEDDIHAEAAQCAFIKDILPRIFPPKKGSVLNSWSGLDKQEDMTSRWYQTILEGTFADRYPKRKLHIQIAIDEGKFDNIDQHKEDLKFDFFLNWTLDADARGCFIQVQREHVRFNLDMRQRSENPLPSDIKPLQEYMNPSLVTPLLMLSLVDYIDRWVKEKEIEPTVEEQGLLGHFKERLISHCILNLFNAELASTIDGLELGQGQLLTGERLVNRLFTLLCNQIWPNYATFIVQVRYKEIIGDYIKALQTLSPKQRRGIEPITGTKDELSRRFGYQRNATFETRARSDLAHLMHIVDWEGRDQESSGRIQLKLHPLEAQFLEAFRSSSKKVEFDGKKVPAMSQKQFLQIGSAQGYRFEEMTIALQLLRARDYVRLDSDKKLIVLASDTRSLKQIESDVQNLLERSQVFASLLESNVGAKQFVEELTRLQEKLNADVTDDELSEIDYRVQQIQGGVGQFVDIFQQEFRSKLSTIASYIRGIQSGLSRVQFDDPIVGTLGFVMPLNELRMRLDSDHKRLNQRLTDDGRQCRTFEQQLEKLTVDSDLTPFAEQVKHLHIKLESVEQQKSKILSYFSAFQDWKTFNTRATTLFDQLASLHEFRRKLTEELVPQIQEVFNQRKLEALVQDYEIFDKKLKVIEAEWSQIRQSGQEAFIKDRTQYEALLQDQLGVEKAALHANYSFDDHQGSYEMLYQQIREKIETRSSELGHRIHEIHTNLLKVTKIQQLEDGQQPEELQSRYDSIKTLADEVKSDLTIDTIRKIDTFKPICEQFKVKITDAGKLKTELEDLARPLPIEADEQQLLNQITPRQATDLTEILVNLLESEESADTENLLHQLENLYRKNRVKITITRLG